MILTRAQLPCFRGAVCMVSGGFDPLHEGHIECFRQAAALGLPVLCNVSSDEFVASAARLLGSQGLDVVGSASGVVGMRCLGRRRRLTGR